MKEASGTKAGTGGCDRSRTFKGGAVTAHSMVCAQALGSGGLAPTASSSGKARNCP